MTALILAQRGLWSKRASAWGDSWKRLDRCKRLRRNQARVKTKAKGK
jgi:hypothetical protein